MTGPSTGVLKIPVRTSWPFQTTERGIATLRDMSFISRPARTGLYLRIVFSLCSAVQYRCAVDAVGLQIVQGAIGVMERIQVYLCANGNFSGDAEKIFAI